MQGIDSTLLLIAMFIAAGPAKVFQQDDGLVSSSALQFT